MRRGRRGGEGGQQAVWGWPPPPWASLKCWDPEWGSLKCWEIRWGSLKWQDPQLWSLKCWDPESGSLKCLGPEWGSLKCLGPERGSPWRPVGRWSPSGYWSLSLDGWLSLVINNKKNFFFFSLWVFLYKGPPKLYLALGDRHDPLSSHSVSLCRSVWPGSRS